MNGCGGDEKKSAGEGSQGNGSATNEGGEEENEEDADDNPDDPRADIGAKNLGGNTQGSLTADHEARKKLGGPQSNPNNVSQPPIGGGSQTQAVGGGSQTQPVGGGSQTPPVGGGSPRQSGTGATRTVPSTRSLLPGPSGPGGSLTAPVPGPALTLYRGLPIVAPTTPRGQEIAGLITPGAGDSVLLDRIDPLMVGGPEFLNEPFTSSAVSLILATGDNTSDPKYISGMSRLNSLGRIHEMRGLLGADVNVSNLELFNVLTSTQANGGISDLISGGDVAAYFTTAATVAGGGSPPPNIMESLKVFRAHSVKGIVDQVMDAIVRQNRDAATAANEAAARAGDEAERTVNQAAATAANEAAARAENEAERRRVSDACATATEALPMYSLDRPFGLMACFLAQRVDIAPLGGDREKIIFGSMLVPQVVRSSVVERTPEARKNKMKLLIISGLVEMIMDILSPGLSRAFLNNKLTEYRNKLLEDPILVEKLINFGFDEKMITPIGSSEEAVVDAYKAARKYAIAMILPLDVIGEVPPV